MYLNGVSFGFQYWVIAVGPATYGAAGLYQFAVVSDPMQLSLFVLARNVNNYMATYDAGVQAMLASAGFNTEINTPLPTMQTNCTYPDLY